MTNYDKFKQKIFTTRPNVHKEYQQLGSKYDALIQVIKARHQQKITQKALAVKIGTKQSSVARFEAGRTNPSLDFLQKISTALNIHLKISINP